MSYFLSLWGQEKDLAMYTSLWRQKPFTLHVALLSDFESFVFPREGVFEGFVSC